MSDTDTSAIDEKKGTSSSTSYMSKLKWFLLSMIVVLIIVLLYFSGGSLILFVCKLAQANIFPTEPYCAPYTDYKPTISPSPMKTNIFKLLFADQSMKLDIPYDINAKNKLIDMFKQYKETPSSNFLANYFISIIEGMIQFNYSAITTIMNLMNETLPDPAIVFLGPLISGFLYGIGLIVNTLYFLYLWFSNMSWFFKTNSNGGEGKPKWTDVSIFSPVNFAIGIWLAFIFVMIGIFGIHIISIIPMFAYHNVLLSMLFYKAILNGKTVSSFSIIGEAMKYYKIPIVIILSIFIVILAFSNLGVIPGVSAIITICLIYWGTVSMDLFKPISENHLSALVSYKQATKTCSGLSKSKHGWLYRTFIGQGGGDNVTRELKHIYKQLGGNIKQK